MGSSFIWCSLVELLLHESQEVIAKTELDVNSELANPNIYDTVQKQPSRGVPRKRCYGVIQENTHVEVRFQESCFSHAKVLLLKICCMFSEHLFLGTPLGGCFCLFKNVENCMQNTKAMKKNWTDGEQINGEKWKIKRNRRQCPSWMKLWVLRALRS